jgi:hypothetical protein
MLRNTSSSASLDALERASSANQPKITTTYQHARGSDTRARTQTRRRPDNRHRGGALRAPHPTRGVHSLNHSRKRARRIASQENSQVKRCAPDSVISQDIGDRPTHVRARSVVFSGWDSGGLLR